jgi:hypothetical protein
MTLEETLKLMTPEKAYEIVARMAKESPGMASFVAQQLEGVRSLKPINPSKIWGGAEPCAAHFPVTEVAPGDLSIVHASFDKRPPLGIWKGREIEFFESTPRAMGVLFLFVGQKNQNPKPETNRGRPFADWNTRHFYTDTLDFALELTAYVRNNHTEPVKWWGEVQGQMLRSV